MNMKARITRAVSAATTATVFRDIVCLTVVTLEIQHDAEFIVIVPIESVIDSKM